MKAMLFFAIIASAVGVYYYFNKEVKEPIMILNEENFNEKTSKGISVVDFYADWCHPCKMLTPVMEELKQEFNGTDVNVFKLNVDESSTIAANFAISSIPQVVLIKDGKEVDRLVGLRSKQDYLDAIKKVKE